MENTHSNLLMPLNHAPSKSTYFHLILNHIYFVKYEPLLILDDRHFSLLAILADFERIFKQDYYKNI